MEILVTGILTGLLCVATTVVFIIAVKTAGEEPHEYKDLYFKEEK